MKLSALFLALVSIFSPLVAENQQTEAEEKIVIAAPQPKKYNFSVCAIFKNEAAYLREWLEYNLIIGVDHFYLYNNSSTDDSLKVLEPYIQKGLVTVIDWPDRNDPGIPQNAPYKWVVYTQLLAYEHACNVIARDESKWLALIDIDEYMLPMQAQTITEILAKYDSYAGVALIWHTYGTSGAPRIQEKGLLIETCHKTCHPDHQFNNKIVKSIVKPELFFGFSWPPHTCCYKDNRRYYICEKKEARINHYINRTEDFARKVKIKNKEHMENRKLADDEINELMALGNDVEDTELTIHRFAPMLKERLGYASAQ